MTNPFAIESKVRELADRAVTDFLSPLSEKRASPDHVRKNAQEILKQSGRDLTPIVAGIAKEENLNPHEIARVAEESNKEAFLRLYKLSDDKTFEFPVADAAGVLGLLDRPYEGPGDIFLPVEHPGFLAKKDMPKAPASWASSALFPSGGQKLQMELEQESLAKQAFTEGMIECEAGKNQAALDFMKIARNLVNDEDYSPSDILGLVCEARPGKAEHEKVAKELLAIVAFSTDSHFPEGAREVAKVASAILETEETGSTVTPHDTTTHDYEFWTRSPGVRTADLVSPLSSAGAPVRVIDGNHKLFLTLDSLVDQTGKENWWGKGLLMSHDRVRTAVRNVFNWTQKSEKVPL